MPNRRRARSGGRRRKTPVDWVYRPTGLFSTAPGTYNGRSSLTVATNTVNQILSAAAILYDSQDYLGVITRESFGNTSDMPKAARAEGRRARCIRVQGKILFLPANGWAEGGRWYMGVRLGWYEQDPQGGRLLVAPEYSMWEPEIVTGAFGDVALWANDRLQNMREWRLHQGYDTEKAAGFVPLHINVRLPIQRAPSSLHCLALYFEAPSTITTLVANTQFWVNCRTLVADEG